MFNFPPAAARRSTQMFQYNGSQIGAGERQMHWRGWLISTRQSWRYARDGVVCSLTLAAPRAQNRVEGTIRGYTKLIEFAGLGVSK
jgi:hypothetical protein